MPTVEHWTDIVRRCVAGHRWIVAQDVLVSAAGVAKRLQDLGASSVLAIGATRGTGPVPAGVATICMDVRATSMMDGIRRGEAALDALPAEHVAAVDAFDPDGSARVVRTIFSEGRPVAGRPTWGARTPAQVALEDKTVIGALWDACAVPQAPHENVALDAAAVRAAFARLDEGSGVVLAGDNRSGWHGGAAYTRHARTVDEAVAIAADYASACDVARVMPFVEGVPCSIHGIVFDDHVAALRPCEMVVLRRDDGTFHYAGVATCWDPSPADRAAMRAMVRRVGAHLRSTVDYRGVFTIDGVLGADGFRPTELNPRFGAAMGGYMRPLEGLPLYLLHLAIAARVDADWQAEALEALLVEAADGARYGRVFAMVDAPPDEPLRHGLRATDDGFALVDPDGPRDALFVYGPAAFGGYTAAVFDDAAVPRGASFAPLAVDTLAWMDATFDLGIGPRTAARDVRAGA